MKFKIKQNKKFNFKFIHYIYFSYFILLGIIVFFPLDFILILIPDDSFYYFETAKNVALYGNVSFDNINKTNGFQPLWLLILIPIFWLKLDCISTLRIIILLTGVISFFTLVFIYKIVKMISSKITAEFCVMLYAFNPFNIIIYLGCSEAALNGLLLSAIFYYILKSDFKKSKGKDFLILGLLSSFSFLARTDNVILIVCLISWVISSGIFKFKKEYIKSFFYFCISVSILPLIYISFNLFYFNHILPISGIVRGMTFYLILFYLIISAIICSIISLIIRIYEFNEKISKILILFFIAPFLHFYYYIYSYYYLRGRLVNWYFVLEVLSLTILISCVLVCFYKKIVYFFGKIEFFLRFKINSKGYIGERIFGLSSILILIIVGCILVPRTNVNLREKYLAAQWLNKNTPSDAIIASNSAGCLGYFTNRSVIEIRGLINSFEFREKYEGNVSKFLSEGEYDYFVERISYRRVSSRELRDLGLILVHEIEDPENPSRTVQIWYHPN